MREVSADSSALAERLGGSPCRPREFIADIDVIMNEVADRLNARPARRLVLELCPVEVLEDVAFARATLQQIGQRLSRELFDRNLIG
jgi:non-ribosomal peptide synthetase component F